MQKNNKAQCKGYVYKLLVVKCTVHSLPLEAGSRNSILATKQNRTCIVVGRFNIKYRSYQGNTGRIQGKALYFSYKQNEIAPSNVIKGRAAVLDTSHFSLDFLKPHINMLVYKKKIMFKLTPNIPRYNGILHEEHEEKINENKLARKERLFGSQLNIYMQKQE